MAQPTEPSLTVSLVSFSWDGATRSFGLTLSVWIIVGFALIASALAVWRWRMGGFTFRDFEIDQTEIGVGQNKLRFKPNLTDRQVAYAIWVELSTRKIGLPIDFEHDVVSEIYNSGSISSR